MDLNTMLEENLDAIRKFCLFDDTFMNVCFQENTEAAQLMLNIILERDDIVITETHTQYTLANLFGKGVRIDIFNIGSHTSLYAM